MRKIRLISVILIISTILVSCQQGKDYSEILLNADDLKIVANESVGRNIENNSREITMMESESNGEVASGITFAEEKLLTYEEEVLRYGGYAFSQLSEEEQVVYYEIYGTIKEMETGVTLSTVDEEQLAYVYYCVLSDHPQFYYVNGYSGMKYLEGERIKRIEIYPEYYMTEEEIAKYQADIDAYLARCVTQLPMYASEYEIAKSVYEFIVLNTQYNFDAPLNQTICSVATYGESVCQGYAEMVQYVLNEMGIFATIVVGIVKSGENHAWNLVMIDGEYYYMDATWGDPEYDVNVDGESESVQMVNYDYLLLNDEQIGITHTVDTSISMPNCVSTKANYYRMENLYFESYDKERLQHVIAQAYETEEKVVSFQCSSREVYDSIYVHLIDDGEIFDFIVTNQTTIAFSANEPYLVLTLWLD